MEAPAPAGVDRATSRLGSQGDRGDSTLQSTPGNAHAGATQEGPPSDDRAGAVQVECEAPVVPMEGDCEGATPRREKRRQTSDYAVCFRHARARGGTFKGAG